MLELDLSSSTERQKELQFLKAFPPPCPRGTSPIQDGFPETGN